ncbi:heme exporter protein CcmB, partial [Myxococcota bacterium]|nr:heme exporter protein CcmB [Myxococcota bacterium]
LLWKDLLCEWRSRDRLVAMIVFSLLVVVVFQFAWPNVPNAQTAALAPGVLWVIYLFAALLGLGRTFTLELENDALSALALAPGTRGFIFLGKAAASFVLLAAVQALTAFVFALFFRLDWLAQAGGLALVVAMADVAIVSVGTLFSAMSVRSRFREVLLPILLIPSLIPVLASAVRATAATLRGEALTLAAVQPLVVMAGIYAILGFLLFDPVLDE